MEDKVNQTKMLDAGNVTGSYLSSPQDLGEFDVADVKQPTKVDFLSAIGMLESRATSPSIKCAVALVLESVDEDVVEKLRSAIANPAVRGSWIAETLRKYGFKISGASVQRHRRGITKTGEGCACE